MATKLRGNKSIEMRIYQIRLLMGEGIHLVEDERAFDIGFGDSSCFRGGSEGGGVPGSATYLRYERQKIVKLSRYAD